ncbi:MAG: hypothetical protein Fur005_03700 [Roseiflexaceae bacterium]
MQQISYGGWPTCYRLSNGIIELIVTADVGPRVIHFGFVGGANQFMEDSGALGLTGGDEWRMYGGHRLWHAPEVQPRTYEPDNFPVTVSESDGWVSFLSRPVIENGTQKQIDIRLSADTAQAELVHRIRNVGRWPIELAPWAISVMAPGGVAILPLPPAKAHADALLPATPLVLWSYTDLTDPRWVFGKRHILLRQDPHATHAQKAGLRSPDGWIGYARDGQLMIKRIEDVPGGNYPDLGCNIESYTSDAMLEIETLAPLRVLEPGQEATHTEHWSLFDHVPMPQNDADVIATILPLLK